MRPPRNWRRIRTMRQFRGCAAAIAVVLALPAVVHAQAMPPADEAIDVQLFNYSIGPKTFFSVDNASTADQKQLALDALVTFFTTRFVLYRPDGATDPSIVCGSPECPYDRVVKTLTVAQLSGAYGITDKIQVGANLPFVFSLAGDGLDPTTGMHSP